MRPPTPGSAAIRWSSRVVTWALIGWLLPLVASSAPPEGVIPASEDAYVRAFARNPVDACRPGEPGSQEACLAQVSAASELEYGRVLRRYEDHLTRFPADAATAVERCRFIRLAALEAVDSDTPREADFESCLDELIRERGEAPEVRILLLEQSVGEDAADAADGLLELAPSPFSDIQRADILEYAARQLQYSDAERASEFARRAMAFDTRRQLATIAAGALRKSDPEAAAKILLGAADQLQDPQVRLEAAAMLVELGQAAEAVRIFDALALQGIYLNRLDYARALTAAGLIERARAMFKAALEQLPWRASEIVEETFDFELAHGSMVDAAASYDALRDGGYQRDPLLRLRAELWLAHPDAPFRPRDLFGLLALMAYLSSGFVFAALVLFPIHYVGLLRGNAERPDFASEMRFGLKHLWFAVGALATLELSLAWGLSYELVAGFFDALRAPPNDPRIWARVTLVSSPLGLVILACMLRRGDLGIWLEGRWSARVSVVTGVASSLVVLSISALNFSLLSTLGYSLASMSSQDVVVALFHEYGFWVFGAVVVIAAPLTEELLFREIGLRALSRYLGFGFANLLQATVFASMHQDPLRFAPLFALGLLGGWLRRRSGSLLAPTMLHAANNAIAVAAITAMPLT